MNPNLNRLAWYLFVVIALFNVAPHLLAAAALDTSTALEAPTTQTGVVSGMAEILRFVFLFLKFLAVIACGFGSYQMWKGEIASGVWSYVAALSLFFAPALVNLAQTLGDTAVRG